MVDGIKSLYTASATIAQLTIHHSLFHIPHSTFHYSTAMRPDILSLREFYGTMLGRFARARMARHLLDRWPSAEGDVMLGLGYATPILRVFRRQTGIAAPVVAAMPRAQGAMYWPARGDNFAIMAHEDALPLGTNTVHRAVLLHALEFTESPADALRELWRVLTPGGRAMLYVANRRGLWASAQATPFGHGTPYSTQQLKQTLDAAGFTLMHAETLVFAPPLGSLLKIANLIEGVCRWVLPGVGGVVAMEVEKQIYAGVREPARKSAANLVWIPAVAGAEPASFSLSRRWFFLLREWRKAASRIA